ncbi:MAG: hypothetical protein ACQEUT_11785 [Bacillota bacterium]
MEKVKDGKVVETVHTIQDLEDIEKLTIVMENERWSKAGLYTGTDFLFKFNEQNVDVLLHTKNNSLEMFRPGEEGTERAVILHEEAENFYELLTGDSIADFEE